mmetsp:Transcript_23878/g.42266  ORF Transcript_23878/g.42266 Transcript_23878/m.42266 type:complete len:341 (-) Transcript_23878:34-1056(-)
MEFADGGDLLGKICNHKKMRSFYSEAELWTIMAQLLSGLKQLHSMKILHRDIKCANVFVCKNGTVKIGDLNVSKVNKRGLAYTQTGTPYYTSPEVWKDQPYDSKCDIWSVGCVLYEAATLNPPFRASSMDELYRKVIRGVYPPLPNTYSEEFHSVIKCMLQVNPKMRPSAEQLLSTPSVINHGTSGGVEHEMPGGLLGTIALPRNITQLSNRLPAPNYERREVPSTRASEPALKIPRPPSIQRAPSHLSPDIRTRRMRAYGMNLMNAAPPPPSHRPISRENVPPRPSYLPNLVQKVEDPKVITHSKQGIPSSRILALKAQYAKNEQVRVRAAPVVPKWWG